MRSLRQVLRKLVRAPGFTATAIVTLGVGIGANVAIFSVVNGVVLEPLPFDEPDRLVSLMHAAPGLDIDGDFGQADATYLYYRERNNTLDAVGMYDQRGVNLAGEGTPELVPAARVTPSLFAVLRAAPEIGRTFVEAEGQPGAEFVTVLSYELWQRRFGGDPDVLGRTIQLDGRAYEIVGVMPRGMSFPGEDTRLWIPLRIDPATAQLDSFNYPGVARLRPGIDVETARADLQALTRQIPDVYPGFVSADMLEQARFTVLVTDLKQSIVGDVESVLWVLLGTVGFVLLIACANVANLFLVRAEGRQREMAVRSAMGASAGRLARGFLGESLMLGLLGGITGVLLAGVAVQVFVANAPATLPRVAQVGIDLDALGFATAVSIIAGLLFGAIPALQFRVPHLVGSLKEGGRGGSAGRRRHVTRNAFVVSQVSLALVLLIGSGLMVRSFERLRAIEPGFDVGGVLTFQVIVPPAQYADNEAVASFYRRLVQRVEAIPGVTSAGAGHSVPLDGEYSKNGHVLEDYPVQPGELPPIFTTNHVSPGYLRTMGIPLIEGRAFTWPDYENRGPVAMVNASLARSYWPGESAVGKRLYPSLGDVPFTIVGIVGDVRTESLIEADHPVVYLQNVQPVGGPGWTPRGLTIVLRTTGSPLGLSDAIRAATRDVDPTIPVANVRTMEAVYGQAIAQTAFAMFMLVVAASVALLLGAVGIYGVISYLVTLRTREIGVRMALGADPRAVRMMVVRQGGRVAAAGLVVGVIGALGLTRFLGALLYEVNPTDPVVFGAVTAILLGVALMASYVPARRASHVPPVEAIRYE